MEELSNSSNPEDDDEENPKAKKKGLTFESFLAAIRKNNQEEKAAKDIGASIFSRPRPEKEEKADSGDKSDATEILSERKDKLEQDSNNLSPDEQIAINRSIAEDHLANPIEAQPAKQVRDFLDQVVSEGDPEGAFETTSETNGWSEPDPIDHVPVAEVITGAPEDDEPIEDTELIEESFVDEAAPESVIPPLEEEIPLFIDSEKPYERTIPLSGVLPLAAAGAMAGHHATSRPLIMNARPRMETTAVLPTILATDLAAYVIGKRVGRKQAAEKTNKERQRIITQVTKLEQNITIKEQRLQQLSTERVQSSKYEQPIKASKFENHIKLTKPQQAERLGRAIIAAEVPGSPKIIEKYKKPNSIRDYYHPEQIKTLRRRELLELSEKIKVEGASLRDMFDNSLFSERALRRLVGQYLKGKDIRPMLRREILEKQIDFERDPYLRDRGSTMSADLSPLVFDRMLEKTLKPETKTTEPRQHANKAESINGALPQSTNKHQVTPGQYLSAFILLLMLLILFLLSWGH